MDWQSLLAAVALLSIAVVAGGATLRLVDAFGASQVVATTFLVAALVVAIVLVTVGSLARSSTPYW